ncbi:GDP-mannose 4,6-dehydratase [Treponema vincentii]|uniref:NAD dependent epimerase/dehydratase family protein n=1 Tax=Treponema vincentii ATCC 35580 TaxID=596324 RepID=C8PNH6_9SPIR|nr:NAD-dependent epimerase/dehydratase family protein [Treponema vincentii]EEV21081.1 NAD dependent epimerase/dehydratase family protein [Treponema vincentii ATCC 35580]UTC60837.1 GDP-mannose 4,6-dehydratase [Treponema vincentii]
MKALIAGGAGFIGSHLADYLLAEGNEVVCIDNFFIGTKQNIVHLLANPRYIFYQYDLNNTELLNQVFEKEKPDYVFHLAANSDIQASAQSPIIEYQNTYSTTFNLLEVMRLHNVKNLFFSSTSAVYGNKDTLLNEETASLAPISYYGGAKLGSEGLISAYAYMNDMNVLIFRFPNVIGPRLTHGVIFDFIKRLKKDSTKLLILGDGNQTKPYLYVLDLVEAIVKFKDVGKGVSLYNVGVDTATSVTRIAEIVCQKMGMSNTFFEYTGGKEGWKGDVPRFQYDLNKIHAAGWTARYTSDEAVALTVENNLM